jgi:predicted NBD/HSP70 family sugar kinase
MTGSSPAIRPGAPTRADERADQTTVRRANLGMVLRHVADRGPCSRAAVATGTGLTRGTVSSLVAELIELGLVRESDAPVGPRGIGRPGIAIELAGTVAAVGLEVNVDYLVACVEDVRGEVRFERRIEGDNRGAAAGPVLDRVAELAREALSAAADEGVRVAGIGAAVPGLVQTSTGMLVRAPNLGWSEVRLADELERRLGVPSRIWVDNEANLAAVAEHWLGVARGLESFLLVFGEIGVGGGIFVGGELFRGAHGYSGELGHVTVDPGGDRCACGSRGCLETIVGQEAIARRAGLDLSGLGRSRPLTDELVKHARAGDPATLAALDHAGATLGVALASSINLLDLECVVLGGAYGPLAPWLGDAVTRSLRERVLSGRWSTCEVRASRLAEGAAVRGAAAQTIRSVLADPWTTARSIDEVRVAVS